MSPYHQALAEKRRRWKPWMTSAASYLTCYIATYDRDEDDPEASEGRFLQLANQNLWHVSTILVDASYSEKRQDCMITLSDYIGLCLRDHVDIISGNWSQATCYLTDCVGNAVDVYEQEKHMPSGVIKWTITDENSEYRTIFFNRPTDGPEKHMWTKEQLHFNLQCATDEKLHATEDIIHSPQFFFMTKPKAERTSSSSTQAATTENDPGDNTHR